MERSNDGLTLWYDTPDAPVGPGSITVGVRPANPTNAVSIRYRVDGGFIRSTAATPLPGTGTDQYFRAPLPEAPDGAMVELLPVLTSGGRQVPSPAGSPVWFRYRQAAAETGDRRPATNDRRFLDRVAGPRFAHGLEFLGTVSVLLGKPPEDVGVTPQGLRRTFYIQSGTCVGPRLNATIRPVGADWMLIQRDGVAIPNVRTTWETPEGALLYGEYSGTFDLGEDGYEKALRNQFPTFPVVQLAPRFVTSHPRYLWLNRLQCVGIGNVDMEQLFVQYDLHAVRGGQLLGKGSR
jgi:hypothetical protein